ncbi:cysteine desulfurase NifS [Fundidesulfovibrio butyratiphilus]
MAVVYLDNNATTRVDPQVLEEMTPYLTELYGNPSSMHTFGGQVGRKVAQARERVAATLNCHPEEVVFTSCGTEGDNTAFNAATQTQPDKRHLVTTKVEHPAVLNMAKLFESRGYEVTYLGVDAGGRLDLQELADSIRPDTALVSVMYANNETGVVFPVEEVARIVKERGSLLHVDAVQALGKLPIDLARLPVDYLAVSGHKVHAPKGVGALFVRKGAPYRPFLIGGHQERGRRAGTENTPFIIALGKACELAGNNFDLETTEVKILRDRLETGLMAAIPDTRRNGDPQNRLPNTTNLAFQYVEGESILLMLDAFGVCASSGSACTSGSLEPSHVLRAMDVPFTYAHGSIRFSLSRFNTEADVDVVLKELPPIISRLRDISPFGRGEGVKTACSR